MKQWLVILASVILVGCATPVPVKQKWPEAPTVLQEPCVALKQLQPEQNTLRDLLMVMIENYAAYYACAGRTQGWQDWYREQKKVHQEANK